MDYNQYPNLVALISNLQRIYLYIYIFLCFYIHIAIYDTSSSNLAPSGTAGLQAAEGVVWITSYEEGVAEGVVWITSIKKESNYFSTSNL